METTVFGKQVYILGPKAVGKTSLSNRFLSDSFGDYDPTMKFKKKIEVDNEIALLNVFDTLHTVQEHFVTMRDEY